MFSCQKKDEQAPTLTITSPIIGQVFSYTPTIDITGFVSDNTGLQAIEVSLLNYEYKIVSGVVRYPVAKNATYYSVSYTINDIYLPAGYYHLRVQAVDLANNRTSGFVQIYLQELPLTLRGVYYLGVDESHNYNSYLYLLGSSTPKLVLDRKTTDICFYPRYNYLYVCSALGATFKGYKLSDTLFPLGFQHYQPNASGWDRYIQMLFLSDKTVLLLSKTEPYFQVFTLSGTLIGSHSNSIDFPTKACEHKERVYALIPGGSVPHNEIDIFNPYSNYAKIHAKNLTEKVLDIATNGIEICVLTRDSTHSYTRYLRTNDLVQVFSNRHYAIKAKKWYVFENTAYIITQTGILKENLLNKTASTTHWLTGTYTALAYEPTTNTIYAATPTHIQKIDANTGTVVQSFSIPSSIKVEKIDFWYNK
ncbi:MAG: Ig-like domain-containing protein [Bacteroidia bacterium]|nr:Ig-like domain-containing protein [Bacteroidia bacterium]MDW8345991.1 Ig-like domain-containing protein [Bacteroidia bacterium]